MPESLGPGHTDASGRQGKPVDKIDIFDCSQCQKSLLDPKKSKNDWGAKRSEVCCLFGLPYSQYELVCTQVDSESRLLIVRIGELLCVCHPINISVCPFANVISQLMAHNSHMTLSMTAPCTRGESAKRGKTHTHNTLNEKLLFDFFRVSLDFIYGMEFDV